MRSVLRGGAAALCACVALGVVAVIGPSQALARPNYKGVFAKKYPKVQGADCKICHPEDDKKVRNDYGKAVGKALGATKVADAKKVQKALDKAGEEKASDGTKFAEKLKKGERPVE